MSRSYPVWNEIKSCSYQSGKSYGVKSDGHVTVRVGTSSSNSHIFLKHSTTHRELPNGDREFRFYLDGDLVRRAVLRKGATELEHLPLGEATA
jgi:hypothetical protein